MSTFIYSVSGKKIDFLNPNPANFRIEDIAWGLSQEVRFSNQIKVPYSVAQHSIMVAKLCAHPLEGLLHDATEAYMRDIPSPLKKLIPRYAELENNMSMAICQAFDLDYNIMHGANVKEADEIAVQLEIIAFRAEMINTERLGSIMSSKQALDSFLTLFNQLSVSRAGIL